MKDRHDHHVKFYRQLERERAEFSEYYAKCGELYSEQLRRYCIARPNWRTMPAAESDFWEIFPNW